MTALEVFRAVVDQKQCHLARPNKRRGGYDARPNLDGKKRGWFYVDLFTASAVTQVHDALNPENQAKFAALPLSRMVDVTWKLARPRES